MAERRTKMSQFEVGKTYRSLDNGLDPLTILERTAKTCIVTNDGVRRWRMKIHKMEGSEQLRDSYFPKKWQGCNAWDASLEEEPK